MGFANVRAGTRVLMLVLVQVFSTHYHTLMEDFELDPAMRLVSKKKNRSRSRPVQPALLTP